MVKSGRLTVPHPQWLDWSTYYRLFSSSALPSYFLFSLLCLASFLQSTLARWRPSLPPPSQVASSVPGSVHLLASLVPAMLSSCPAQFLSSSVPAQPISPSAVQISSRSAPLSTLSSLPTRPPAPGLMGCPPSCPPGPPPGPSYTNRSNIRTILATIFPCFLSEGAGEAGGGEEEE